MTYTLVTGNVLYPSQTPYQNISLIADITLNWPSSFIGGIPAAYFTDVTPVANGNNITLPDATLGSEGNHLIFYNSSIYNFNILKNDSTLLLNILAGQSVDFILKDNSTSAGVWTTIPFGGGSSNINAFQITSSDNSLVITNGNVTPPGANIDLQLTPSISNLNKVNTTGLPVIFTTNPLTWGTVEIVAGNNITIDNGDGFAGNPIINVNSNLIGITAISVGQFSITGSELSANVSNTDLNFSTSGTGKLNLNGTVIDADGNITATGFKSPGSLVAWAVFNDTSGSIVIEDAYNVSSIVRDLDSGTYKVTFTLSMSNINYAIIVTTGSTGDTMPLVTQGYYIATTRDLSSVELVFVDASREIVSDLPNGATFQIMSSG